MNGTNGNLNVNGNNNDLASLTNASPYHGLRNPLGVDLQVERFESQIRKLTNDIDSTVQLHINGLIARRDSLLKQLERIRKIYSYILGSQSRLPAPFGSSSNGSQNGLFAVPTTVALAAIRLASASSNGSNDLASSIASVTVGNGCTNGRASSAYSINNTTWSSSSGVDTSFLQQLLLDPDDYMPLPKISFTGPDHALYRAVTSLGFLNVPAFAPYCTAHGDGLERVMPGNYHNFSINTRNCFNEEIMVGRDSVVVSILGYGMSLVPAPIDCTVTDHNNGRYTVSYYITDYLSNTTSKNHSNASSHGLDYIEIIVNVNGILMTGCPFKVKVHSHNSGNTWKRVMIYGSEGNLPGQFCRPWGVALAKYPLCYAPSSSSTSTNNLNNTYMIAVADRSNNRIQIFRFETGSKSIMHLFNFGSGPGTSTGMFNRPAGICINSNLGTIAVADKDNHRIQIFDLYGKFLLKFGSKGVRAGQFCYPWDIDVCSSTNHYVVSDTRNRRVQLFTSNGTYLTHFSDPLDSPRSVAFLHEHKILVSDFNKHFIVMIPTSGNGSNGSSSNGSSNATPSPTLPFSNRHIGYGEGSNVGEFTRPQGVAVADNFVYCSDSRNNRICCYDLETEVYEYLSEELSLDRPSGIAVLDSVMVIVDFGHNRLQIFLR